LLAGGVAGRGVDRTDSGRMAVVGDASERDDVAARLTRRQAAERLGISVSAVRRMEGKELHPKLVAGLWLFDSAEVTALQRVPKPGRRPRSCSDGDISAELFQRFDRGQSLRRIVKDLHQPPDRVRALFREWSTPLGDELASWRASLPDDNSDLERWEATMREQIATEEDLDRQDRELHAGRRQAGRRSVRQA
jgi:hypothetical protein